MSRHLGRAGELGPRLGPGCLGSTSGRAFETGSLLTHHVTSGASASRANLSLSSCPHPLNTSSLFLLGPLSLSFSLSLSLSLCPHILIPSTRALSFCLVLALSLSLSLSLSLCPHILIPSTRALSFCLVLSLSLSLFPSASIPAIHSVALPS